MKEHLLMALVVIAAAFTAAILNTMLGISKIL